MRRFILILRAFFDKSVIVETESERYLRNLQVSDAGYQEGYDSCKKHYSLTPSYETIGYIGRWVVEKLN